MQVDSDLQTDVAKLFLHIYYRSKINVSDGKINMFLFTSHFTPL